MNQVKKKLGRGLALLLAVLQVMLVFTVVPVSAADDPVASGYCGNEASDANLTWTLDSAGTLTISKVNGATGGMKSYQQDSESGSIAPWREYDVKKVVVEEGVTTIGQYAFYGCEALTSVTLPDSMLYFNNFAFENCTSLESIEIPSNVWSLGSGAFEGCSSLKSVTIPSESRVERIENSAFNDCISLTSITIPNKVTAIGNAAFYGCKSLTSVSIPESVTSIESYAFSGCGSSMDVTYAGSMTQWRGINIEDGNDYLFETTIHCTDGDITLTHMLSGTIAEDAPGNFVLETDEKSKAYEVTAREGKNVSYCVQADEGYVLAELTVDGSSVEDAVNESKYTGTYTMGDHDAVITVRFKLQPDEGKCGDSLTWKLDDGTLTISGTGNMKNYSLGDPAPWNSKADQIKKVVMEAGVTSVGVNAFYGCKSLTSVTIPEGVTCIYGGAFAFCSSLTSVTIPEGVTIIGGDAFDYCSSLTSVNIPEGVTTIGSCAFRGCALTSVAIPASVTSIGATPFGAGSLQSLTVAEENQNYCAVDGVLFDKAKTYLYVYSGGTERTEYQIPDSVTTIGQDAFWNCANLTSVTIPESVTTVMPGAFEGCSGLTSVTIPDSITTIESKTFSDCSSLPSVVIPDGVTSIKMGAFSGCSSLPSVTIPADVTAINDLVFYECDSLTDVTYGDTMAQWIKITISDGNDPLKAATIHCTDGDIVGSGACGEKLTWMLDAKGTLTISGNGEMPDYFFSSNKAPWVSSADKIQNVVIGSGVTYIGGRAFDGYKNLTSASISGSVTSIGAYAFNECDNLAEVTYDATMEEWDEIEISEGNDPLKAAEIHCTDGDIVITYKLSGDISENGSFAYRNGGRTTSYEVSAKKDTNVWYCVYADDGYVLKDLTIDDTAIPEAVDQTMYSGDYTMQDHDATITAEFKPVRDDGFTIEIGGDLRNGTVSVENDVVKAGETVTVTVKANPGYRLDYLTYNYEVSGEDQHRDVSKDDSGAYTFEMPARNVYLDAAFVIDQEYDFTVYEREPDIKIAPDVTGFKAEYMENAEVTGIGGAVDANAVLEKSGIDETTEMTLRAEVTVTAADLGTKTVSFEVKPVAVVLDVSTASGILVEISNDMLNGNPITVKLPIPDEMDPQEIVHISEDGTKEYYTLNGAKPFTIETLSSGQRVAVLQVTHFSTFTMTGAAHEHDIELKDAKKATCTVDGYTGNEVCKICGETVKTGKTIPATGHKTELRNAKKATCTEEGYTGDKVCTVCGETIEKGQTIAKLAHTYDEGKITTEPSCQTEGVKTYSCTVCGATYTEKVAKTEHKKVEIPAVEATCTTNGTTAGIKCSVCGEVLLASETVPAKGHTWDDGKVTKKPTIAAEGVKTYTCTVCGATKDEAIEKLKACDGGTNCPAYGYHDVDTQRWYHLQVDYVIESKLMVGDGGGIFRPNEKLTRAEMAQIMYSAAGRPAVTGKSEFTDVKDTDWFAKAVIWATQNGVVYGVGDGKFAPNDLVTREQLVAMIYRYAKAPAAAGTLDEFADASKVSNYAVDAMRWAVEEGIVRGDGTPRKLRPSDNASRAEVATILYQYFG